MVPSIGIEPMTFPMSRERATAAPTGLKSVELPIYYSKLRFMCKAPPPAKRGQTPIAEISS